MAALVFSFVPLDAQARELVDAVSRGFMGYLLLTGLALVVVVPVLGLLEGVLMRRAIARSPNLSVVGPALLIAARRAYAVVFPFSMFAAVVGAVMIIAACIAIFTDPGDLDFNLVALVVGVVMLIAGWRGGVWAANAEFGSSGSQSKVRRGRTAPRAASKYRAVTVHRRGRRDESEAATAAPTDVGPDFRRMQRVWRVGEFLLNSGVMFFTTMAVLVALLGGDCAEGGPSCAVSSTVVWGLGASVLLLVAGILFMLLAGFSRARLLNKAMAEMTRAAQDGDGRVTLTMVRARVSEPGLAEPIVGAIAGVLAIMAGIAVGPALTNAVLDTMLRETGIGTGWILPVFVALCLVAALVDWSSARRRDRILALAAPTAGTSPNW